MTSLTSAPPASRTSPDRTPRSRLRFWRSPAGQPRWARPALLGIAALAALLYTWNITSSGYAPYYSVAARSMSVSWEAFLFTSLDPSAALTLDKIGGFLWPQALSARIFGFHDWALTLPQCVMGVISVLVMYRLVRRWQGPAAGLLAAGLLTVTPVAASMFGHAMLDGSVTMCLVLAADQYQRAVRSARLRSLLLCALWIGLGFQAKMMEAWVIVPALFVGYLVAAPVRLRRRLGQLALAGALMFTVSLSWVALMTFTPERDRPYVDGSTDNSAAAMVFGYNGFNRLHAGLIDGAALAAGAARTSPGPDSGRDQAPPKDRGTANDQDGRARGTGSPGPDGTGAPGPGPDGAPEPDGAGGTTGKQPRPDADSTSALKLFESSRYAPQIGWLYPLALCSLVYGLLRHRKAPRTDRTRAGYLMWGVWLIGTAALLSSFDFPHTAYLAPLAPPLAALAAAGTVALRRAHGKAESGVRVWVLPAVIVAETAWTVRLASDYTDFAPWLIPLTVAAALGAVLALTLRRTAARRRFAAAGLLAGCVAMFAAPTAWSLSVLNERHAGSAFDAAAGPLPAGLPTGKPSISHRPGAGDGPGGGAGPTGGVGAVGRDLRTSLTPAQSKLLGYVQKHDGDTEYTFSAENWEAAAPYIYAEGTPVLPLAGMHSTSVTLIEYRHLVASGDLRFALVTDAGSKASEIGSWVASACAEVDPRAYGGAAADAEPAPANDAPEAPAPSLYRCEPSDATSH
ncbi:ArnT family glycosyltransferase [Streptomyces sp. NPDC020607]|uniref:ArnT family glycosyltransferase n=1 Tax=Streptomyces sp. NPDC020607 TaxID=3365082 RepID=UPI0037B922F6